MSKGMEEYTERRQDGKFYFSEVIGYQDEREERDKNVLLPFPFKRTFLLITGNKFSILQYDGQLDFQHAPSLPNPPIYIIWKLSKSVVSLRTS